MMIRKLLLAVSLVLCSSPVWAQHTASSTVPGYYANAPQTGCTIGPCFVPYGQTVPVSGTFSASLAGFNPTSGATANLTASTTSSSVNLPAGTDVSIVNSGANTAHIRLTTGASTAVTTDQTLVAGAAVGFHLTAQTVFSAITDTSTTTLNIQGGAGLVTGYGGGSSGGGGGGVVTQPTAANLNATVVGTGTFATQLTGATNNINNVSGTVSLPTGASTAALQPTNSAQGATTSGQTGHLVMGAVTTAAPSYTTAQTSPLSLDTAGNLRVNVIAGGGTGGTSVAQGSTTSGQNVSPMGCRTLTSAPTDTTAQTNMPSCDTSGALRVNVTTATGVSQGSTTSGQTVSPVGCRTLTSAPTDTTAQTNMPWCTTKGSLVIAQPTAADFNATVVGTGTFATQATPTAGTTGGATTFTLTAAASTNATNIKASAGQVYHISAYNNSATLAWISFYDTSGTPTCGTSIKYQVMIPANSTSGAGAVEDIAIGKNHASGIGICVTTGIAGTGSVAATSYVINVDYK